MTEDRMALLDLVKKGADADLVRDMLAFAADRIMEAEADVAAGAVKGAYFPTFLEPPGPPRRPWWPRCRRPTSTASPRAPSMTW